MRAFDPTIETEGSSSGRPFSASGGTSGWRSLAARLAIPLLLGWIVLSVFPPLPTGVGSGVDASWSYALNLAHAQHLVFGKDIVFMYGPLGYITCPDFDLAEPAAVILFWFFTYFLFLWGTIRCWRDLPHRTAFVCSLTLTAMMLVYSFTKT